MINRSQDLLKKRGSIFEKRKAKEKNEVQHLFSKISGNLAMLDGLVSQVEKECTLYCIPTFNSKIEIVKRIEGLKYEIAVNLTKAKGIMDHFSSSFKKSINHILVESVGVHFHYKIDKIIARMNESLRKIEAAREEEAQMEEKTEEQGNKAGIESVYKSVYYINTIIRELKTVVISQSDKIERLDMAMDHVSSSAYKSINEISSISTFGSHMKNRIISVLFCSILVLVVLSTIKAYAHSSSRIKQRKSELKGREYRSMK
ncbi:hypothetical protein NEMIN01_0368 [Nematocida minor]|uniref:uncharacterized protein n=1 Tax=Nematocida minor TaxID=1912983 RepID=UPI00221E387B|nr:uncharacterized protein NEMIN01_0368 [Nematocida minor]KAI5189202.1 hypothetical protein NEMIN01_0368 [Nematocida minor]